MRRSILVIEDEQQILKLVRMTLAGDQSYDVRCAATAAVGLNLGLQVKRVPVHLLLINVMLDKGILGTDVAAKIKAARPDMRVMLIDGKKAGEVAVLDCGWQTIEKRFIGEELLSRVRMELKGAGAGAG